MKPYLSCRDSFPKVSLIKNQILVTISWSYYGNALMNLTFIRFLVSKTQHNGHWQTSLGYGSVCAMPLDDCLLTAIMVTLMLIMTNHAERSMDILAVIKLSLTFHLE